MSILHCATIRWSTLMSRFKFYRVTKHSTLRASSQLTLKLVITIRYTRAKMLNKLLGLFNKSLKEEIFSKKMIYLDIIWLFSGMEKMPCSIFHLCLNFSQKPDSIWSSIISKMTLWKRHLILSKICSLLILESTSSKQFPT